MLRSEKRSFRPNELMLVNKSRIFETKALLNVYDKQELFIKALPQELRYFDIRRGTPARLQSHIDMCSRIRTQILSSARIDRLNSPTIGPAASVIVSSPNRRFLSGPRAASNVGFTTPSRRTESTAPTFSNAPIPPNPYQSHLGRSERGFSQAPSTIGQDYAASEFGVNNLDSASMIFDPNTHDAARGVENVSPLDFASQSRLVG